MKKILYFILPSFGVIFCIFLIQRHFNSTEKRNIVCVNPFLEYNYTIGGNIPLAKTKKYYPDLNLVQSSTIPFERLDTIFLEKKVEINEQLVVDSNKVLVIRPNTEIAFGENGGIICYSKIIALGSFKNEICFHASKKQQSWKNITIVGNYKNLNIQKQSVFKNCVFKDGSGIDTKIKSYRIEDSLKKFTNYPSLNVKTTTRGGAIAGFMTNISVDSCIFENNNAANGGAILLRCGSLSITNSFFKNNFSVFTDPTKHDTPSGTTIFCRGDRFCYPNDTINYRVIPSKLTVVNTVFVGNNAKVNREKGETTDNNIVNGTIYLGKDHALTNIRNNVFDSNTVDACGAVLIHHIKNGVNMVNESWDITNNIITNNEGSIDHNEAAPAQGGALISISNLETPKLDISGNTFYNNKFKEMRNFNVNAYIYINRPKNLTCTNNKINDKINRNSTYIALNNIDIESNQIDVQFGSNEILKLFTLFSYPVYIYPSENYDEKRLKSIVAFGTGTKFLPHCNYNIDKSMYGFIKNLFLDYYFILIPILLILIFWWSGKLLYIFLAINTFFGVKASKIAFLIFKRYLLDKKTILKMFNQYFQDFAENVMLPSKKTSDISVIFDLYKGIPLQVNNGLEISVLENDKEELVKFSLEHLKKYFNNENKLLFWAVAIDDEFLRNILTFYIENGILKLTTDKVDV
jgi:hypothetical protein